MQSIPMWCCCCSKCQSLPVSLQVLDPDITGELHRAKHFSSAADGNGVRQTCARAFSARWKGEKYAAHFRRWWDVLGLCRIWLAWLVFRSNKHVLTRWFHSCKSRHSVVRLRNNSFWCCMFSFVLYSNCLIDFIVHVKDVAVYSVDCWGTNTCSNVSIGHRWTHIGDMLRTSFMYEGTAVRHSSRWHMKRCV